jgi:hypothetical protein
MAERGRKAHQTSTIVVQVWIVGNERKRKLFWEGFPFEGARVEEIDENRLRKWRGMSKVER